MERNKFLVFCFAFVPGAGQMFLGGNCRCSHAQFGSSLRIFANHLVLCFF